MPFNNTKDVIRFLHVLPPAIADEADSLLDVQMDDFFTGRDFPSWPKRCTLRGWLTVCADIHALPDREDLRALSVYCSHDHPLGKEQSEKLRSLCETSESALYADYILREKRTWVDVFFDFESLRAPGTKLTIGSLFQLLPAIRPREYSIASSPSTPAFEDEQKKIDLDPENQSDTRNESFAIELCVGTVEGTTKRGRKFHGLCSYFLSTALPSQPVIVWIRPGSFGKLPLGLAGEDPIASFSVPVIYIGAGTGIAPMRSLLLRRMAVSTSKLKDATAHDIPSDLSDENILVFGCRRKDCDFYYEDQFVTLAEQKRIRLMTAFSRDQFQKIYVQHIVRDADDGKLIAAHILDRNGAVYIAGAPRMAHAVKDELVEALVARLGNKKLAYGKINKMRQEGKFAIEAWS
jgi:sulfite reductase alpha subunit-like flavoprotein